MRYVLISFLAGVIYIAFDVATNPAGQPASIINPSQTASVAEQSWVFGGVLLIVVGVIAALFLLVSLFTTRTTYTEVKTPRTPTWAEHKEQLEHVQRDHIQRGVRKINEELDRQRDQARLDVAIKRAASEGRRRLR